MKYWVDDKWANTFNHEGLLFLVQKAQELLYHFSNDINRASVHNTVTLLKEYLDVDEDVRNKKTGAYQLQIIYDEIKHCIKTDPILYDHLGNDQMDELHEQLKKCSESKRLNLIKYIYDLIYHSYNNWIIDYLKKHINKGNHKTEIEYGIRTWISNQIFKGYSKEFIYKYIESSIINQHIQSLDCLDVFFERFNFETRKYKVYFKISKDIENYFSILSTRLNIKFADDGNFKYIPKKENYAICYLEIDSLDYFRAIEHAYEIINIYLRYYQFITNNRQYLLYKNGAVWDCENQKLHSHSIIPKRFKSIQIHPSNISTRTIDSAVISVYSKDSELMETLNNAITLHNNALHQNDTKDSFINLWSIFEVFCSQNGDESKIDSILYCILPILQKDYYFSLFESIDDDLKDNLANVDYESLISSITGETSIQKIAAFCLLDEYDQLRENYFSKLSKYPRLRHKIYSMYLLRTDKKSLFNKCLKYRQRVAWHIYRLYRARNSIVHSGITPSGINVLAEHLHSYIDSVINELLIKAVRSMETISNSFIDTRILMDKNEKLFNSSASVEYSDIENLLCQFFHSYNA